MFEKRNISKEIKDALNNLEKEINWALEDINRDSHSIVESILVRRIAKLADKAAIFVDLYKEKESQ